jgi:hypothetical protein
MKNLITSAFMTIVLFLSANTAIAQDDCMEFFPSNPGAMLVNKTYDAKGNLLRTMTYKLVEAYDYGSSNDIQITFTMTDKNNKVLDQGNLETRCDNGVFYMKMVNKSMSPDLMDILSTDTELVGDFLDYPDTFNEDIQMDNNPFDMDAGEFSIQSKSDKKNPIRVRVFNRQYVGNEKIKTPVKTFDASKITFDFEVTKDKKTTRYKGIEWYAVNAGIVRSETRDNNNNIVNYTEITTLKDK